MPTAADAHVCVLRVVDWIDLDNPFSAKEAYCGIIPPVCE
jgi:hypothetical protein